MKLQILFEDNHLLIVYKEQNISCNELAKSVDTYLRDKKSKTKEDNLYLEQLYTIDDCIGGVMVYCLTSKCYERCQKLLDNNDCEFKFMAVTVGKTELVNGFYDKTIEYTKDNGVRRVPELNQSAIRVDFNYRKLDEKQSISLYMLDMSSYNVKTIRYAMAELNAPIFGDAEYKGDSLVKGTFVALYLVDFCINHPITNNKMVFRCLPPIENKPWSYFNIEKFLKV